MNDLMTLDDIAAMWKARREWVRRYLVRRPEFPAPAPGSTPRNRRWLVRDVAAFLNSAHESAHES